MFFGSDKVYIDPLFLEGWSSYFRHLPEADKDKFIERLHIFIEDKNFEGREGLEINDEIKICISAAAVTITFGLDEFLLPHFHTVIVYPSAFYSKIGNAYHKGETAGAGVIVFSWEHFKEGYANQHDRVNLGMHEWAHALMLTGFFDMENRDEHFSQYFNKWRFEAQDEFQHISRHKDVFREYGGTNFEEFFAVCTEVFFEDPHIFKQKAPSMFRHFCVLLNQFPLGTRDELLKNISETAEKITSAQNIVIEPEKNNGIYLLYFDAALVIGAVTIGTYISSIEFGIVLGCVFLLNMFLSFSKKIFGNNSLEITDTHITVKNRRKMVVFSSTYDDVVNMHINLGDVTQHIYFNVLDETGIRGQRFTFRYDDEKIGILRRAMHDRKIPLTTTNAI